MYHKVINKNKKAACTQTQCTAHHHANCPPLDMLLNFLAKWGGMFSDDNHMAVIIEWIHSSASLNTNPTESFVTAANRGCLSGAPWVHAGWVYAAEGLPWYDAPSGRHKADGWAMEWRQRSHRAWPRYIHVGTDMYVECKHLKLIIYNYDNNNNNKRAVNGHVKSCLILWHI